MKYLTFVCLISLLFSSCSLTSKTAKRETGSSDDKGRPEWVNKPDTGCKKSELCASGSGTGRNVAKADARNSMSKIFETQISSTFESKLAQQAGEISEDINEQIKEVTNTVLEGVEIKEVYETPTEYFALAVLDKVQAAKRFKTEIQGIDSKMKAFFEDKTPASAYKAEKLFVQREVLAKRYQFLSGKVLRSPYTFKQLFQNKQQVVSGIVVHVYLDEEEPKEIENYLAETLTKMGYQITRGKVRSKNSTHVVMGSITAEEDYLKVKGFKKFKISFDVSSGNVRRVTANALSFNQSFTGRDFTQAYNKAVPQVKRYIDENLDKLNFK